MTCVCVFNPSGNKLLEEDLPALCHSLLVRVVATGGYFFDTLVLAQKDTPQRSDVKKTLYYTYIVFPNTPDMMFVFV